MILKSNLLKFYSAASSRFRAALFEINQVNLTKTNFRTFSTKSSHIFYDDDNLVTTNNHEKKLSHTQKSSYQPTTLDLLQRALGTESSKALENLFAQHAERTSSNEVDKISASASFLSRMKSQHSLFKQRANYMSYNSDQKSSLKQQTLNSQSSWLSQKEYDNLTDFLKNEIDGSILWLVANSKDKLECRTYINILKTLHQASLIEDLIASIKHLQFSIHKDSFSLTSIRDLIVILDICKHLQQLKKFYSAKILLYNIEYILSEELLLSASQEEIMKLLQLYTELVSNTPSKETQRYFLKTLGKLELIFMDLLLPEINKSKIGTEDDIPYLRTYSHKHQSRNYKQISFQAKISYNLITQIIELFHKARYYSPNFMSLLESQLVANLSRNKTFKIKPWATAIEKLVWQQAGTHSVHYIAAAYTNNQSEVTNKFTIYNDKYLAQLGYNICLYELENLYSQTLTQSSRAVIVDDIAMKLFTLSNFKQILGLNQPTLLASTSLPYNLIEQSFKSDLQHFIKINSHSYHSYWLYTMATWLYHSRNKDSFKGQQISNLQPNLLEDSKYSLLHRDRDFNQFSTCIIQVLTKNQLKFNLESRVGTRRCDISLPDFKIIIELDGSYHYFMNEPTISRVGTKLRNVDLMLFNGWKVLEISHLTWEKLSTSGRIEQFILGCIEKLRELDQPGVLQSAEYIV